MKVEYSANNSGGRWWHTGQDMKNLEKAGWVVDWHHPGDAFYSDLYKECKATSATYECAYPGEAIRSFQKVTNLSTGDEGCSCCGPPHNFSWKDDEGNYGYAGGEECYDWL